MSNSLDPDQAGHFVGPDLGPNCLQRLSADDKSRHEWEKELNIIFILTLKGNKSRIENILQLSINKVLCMYFLSIFCIHVKMTANSNEDRHL